MLREVLKLLFQNQQLDRLLVALRQQNRDGITPVNSVDKEQFVYQACRRGTNGSLDQFIIQLDVARDYYFNNPEDVSEIHFSETPSVFNTLLHFTKDKLIVDNSDIYCRYRTVDDWHDVTSRLGEDLFTTSYLAAYDLKHCIRQRKRFEWNPYLNVETSDMNHLFSLDLSDIHAHLKGSSTNFELSWLSLMNYPCHRESEFLKLFDKKKFEGDDKKMCDIRELYLCMSLAMVLRLWLFASKMGFDETTKEEIENCIKDLNKDKSIEEIAPILNNISAMAWNYRTEYGYHYDVDGMKGKVPDYAITEGSAELFSLLSGERSILYHAFLKAYDGDEKVSLYLYAYIIFKQQLREKIIQLNDVVGFANFDYYERRKSCFIPDDSIYDRLLIPMAFLTFLGQEGGNRYMEGRVVPKSCVEDNSEAVRKMDRCVHAWLHEKDNDGEEYKKTDKTFNGHYIYHFIKEADIEPSAFSPRHYKLRQKVKRQAVALFDYRNKGYKNASRIVGIDAANSEIKCRPEVFAQAFRFLRRHDIKEDADNHPSSLGFTYHVGEDYYDIVDGLRAVDEVLTYLNFRSNDRLGHALVLGADVTRYYDSRDKAIRATRQVLLDNFVWLSIRVAKIAGRIALCEYLEDESRHLYRQIYTEAGYDEPFNIHNYYESWLLRGDDPKIVTNRLETKKDIELNISAWTKCAKNEADKDVCRARNNPKARDLYYEYHFNKTVKENGNKAVILPIAHNHYAEFVEMVDKVRELLLCKIERLHIAIECNPSSNLRIGEMRNYIEHPIFKFNNYGIKTPYPPHEISVSINTDDSGVFSTSLEREYTLMGIALEKTDDERFSNSPRAVREWLNRVRKMSVEQRFKK